MIAENGVLVGLNLYNDVRSGSTEDEVTSRRGAQRTPFTPAGLNGLFYIFVSRCAVCLTTLLAPQTIQDDG
jgi:hypothetical protein